jgi:septum formation protein
VGQALAVRGDLESPQSVTRLVLASTSPQRRAILEQLGLPFDAVAPRYEEHDPAGLDPVAAVRAHALGKARSVEGGGRTVLGVDTEVVMDGRTFGKPASPREAAEMLAALAGRTHEVVSGLCLLAPGVEILEHDVTRVTFRALAQAEIDAYVETGEWTGRAGGYAIQGRGAALVARIEGDYLNVVGLPAALLVGILAERLPAWSPLRPRPRGPLRRPSSTLPPGG